MRKADTTLGGSGETETACSLKPLENRLVSIEQSTLHSIRFHINEKLVWPAIVSTTIIVLEGMLGTLIKGKPSKSWLKAEPQLLGKEVAFLWHKKRGDMRREYLILLLVQKLLTLARNEVKKRIQKMRAMSPEEEEALLQRVEEKKPAIEIPPFNPLDMSQTGTESMGNLALHRPSALADTCTHNITKIAYYTNAQDSMVKEVYCRLCNQTLEKSITAPAVCRHRFVEWAPGKEGKEAVCSSKSCGIVVPNPDTYQWGSVGLEPFGDDPSKDEIIFLGQDL